jgi:DNA-binding NtrC family response regulator
MERQIVIVTPNVQFQVALEIACSNQDLQVVAVSSAAAAMESAARTAVGVVIADVTIGEVGDGVTLVEAIHQQYPNSKCFLIAEQDSLGLVNSIAKQSWVKVFAKPIQMLRFSAAVIDACA